MNTYEVSSKGDKRFSALYARFKPNTTITLSTGHITETIDVSNMTIENVYQYKVKKSGKGKKPDESSILYNPKITSKKDAEYFSYRVAYLPLWQKWAEQNPELIEELRKIVKSGKILVDSFAKTYVNQANALMDIIRIINHLKSIK